ncbi:MAG: branched-chain amino acid ABC transporter substrate-binding protein [Burkholderiales bacterium]|nr:MAG: branched-chain amino acid ABC transporter substrate-binding protein [Burkholderiales bacterium]
MLLKRVLAATTSGGFLSAIGQVAGINTAQSAPIKIALIEALSGAFANTGEAMFRNLVWATERVNARGGVQLAGSVVRRLEIERYDSKGQVEEALAMLRAAIDDGAQIIMQGNSSSVAAALIDAIGKHNERVAAKRLVFLNYSAVDPILTNEKCSPWHFRFDAHADMRMTALMEVLREDRALKSIYLIGQDYSFGQAVLREGKRQLALQRSDIAIVGDELHPLGRIKDFAPYAAKIKTSGAGALLTGNFGNDLTLLIKACKEVGFDGKFYTFYGNALGAPAAISEAGIGKVIAVADWLPNVAATDGIVKGARQRQADTFMQAFRARFPKPEDDYVHMRMHLMMEALAQALQGTNSASLIDTAALAHRLAKANVSLFGQSGSMRAADHQFQQPLVVGLMDKRGTPGVKYDVEGSGYGFRVIRVIDAAKAQMPTSCKMASVG